MGEIFRYDAGGSVPAHAPPGPVPDAGPGRWVDSGGWNGKVLRFEDLVGTPQHADVIASMARLVLDAGCRPSATSARPRTGS